MNFRCNYRKCRKDLTVLAIVTSCSHIFCPDHSPGKLISDVNNPTKRRDIICPVCKTLLNQAFDFVEADLQPNDSFKGMVLTGLRPETIIEITARALGFWMYQMEQELQYNQYLIKKQIEKAGDMESEFLKAYNSLKEEKNIACAEKDNLSRECEELREKLIVESRLVQKMKGEQKFLLGQSNEKSNRSFAIPTNEMCADRSNQFSSKFFLSGSNSQVGRSGLASLMHKSSQMIISPDSTLGSPSKFALQKTDQANRVWGISQYNNSNSLQRNDKKEISQQHTRKFLSPLENILNQKAQPQKNNQKRSANSNPSMDCSMLSFGFN